MLPYASDELVRAALDALNGAIFDSDTTDQFLTMLAMDSMADYDGDSDFGTLTRIDLDEEDRVVLTLLEGTEYGLSWAGAETVIGYGGDQKWWADWSIVTAEEADKAQAEFGLAYSEYLGCEDCGSPDGECICDHDPTVGPIPVGTTVKVDAYRGVAFRVDAYLPNGEAETHMIGDDTTYTFDPADLTVVEEDVCDCGQLGCGFNVPE